MVGDDLIESDYFETHLCFLNLISNGELADHEKFLECIALGWDKINTNSS